MPLKIVGIVQARMGSERLPGKVLTDLGGSTVLERCLNRATRSHHLSELLVATTKLPEDDAIEKAAYQHGLACYRGSAQDLLDRYYQAACQHGADVIVRLTADNPLIDPEVIDMVIVRYLDGDVDYVCNRQPRTFPLGLDVEVFSMQALQTAWSRDTRPDWREHVTPYIIFHDQLFQRAVVRSNEDYSYLRWTVDTAEDLDLCREIYAAFPDDRFGWHEALALVQSRPELVRLNSHVCQRKVSRQAEASSCD